MKRRILFLMFILCVVCVNAQNKLTVEQDGGRTTTYNLSEIGRIDFTSPSTIKIIGKDGSILVSDYIYTVKRINFTDNIQTAVKSVNATLEPTIKSVRKRVVNRRLLIEASDGRVYNITGQQIK